MAFPEGVGERFVGLRKVGLPDTMLSPLGLAVVGGRLPEMSVGIPVVGL